MAAPTIAVLHRLDLRAAALSEVMAPVLTVAVLCVVAAKLLF